MLLVSDDEGRRLEAEAGVAPQELVPRSANNEPRSEAARDDPDSWRRSRTDPALRDKLSRRSLLLLSSCEVSLELRPLRSDLNLGKIQDCINVFRLINELLC